MDADANLATRAMQRLCCAPEREDAEMRKALYVELINESGKATFQLIGMLMETRGAYYKKCIRELMIVFMNDIYSRTGHVPKVIGSMVRIRNSLRASEELEKQLRFIVASLAPISLSDWEVFMTMLPDAVKMLQTPQVMANEGLRSAVYLKFRSVAKAVALLFALINMSIGQPDTELNKYLLNCASDVCAWVSKLTTKKK